MTVDNLKLLISNVSHYTCQLCWTPAYLTIVLYTYGRMPLVHLLKVFSTAPPPLSLSCYCKTRWAWGSLFWTCYCGSDRPLRGLHSGDSSWNQHTSSILVSRGRHLAQTLWRTHTHRPTNYSQITSVSLTQTPGMWNKN